MSFLINEQLHQKNALLQAYQQQNSQLKSWINKQKTSQFVRIPKDGALKEAINRLEFQNKLLKERLNESIAANTDVINKAEREKIFNRKLERENEWLKQRLGEMSRLLEAERGQKLTEDVLKEAVNLAMVNGGQVGGRQNKAIQQAIVRQLPQPSNIFASLFSQNPQTLQSNSPQQDMVLRSLAMHRQKLQAQQQISFLKNELQKCQKQLQSAQKQVRSLQQKVLQLQEKNHSAFIMTQNDKLAGELVQERLVREALEMAMGKVREENLQKEKEIQLLKQSLHDNVFDLAQEIEKDQRSVRNQFSSRNQITQKQTPERQKSIKQDQNPHIHHTKSFNIQNPIQQQFSSHEFDIRPQELTQKRHQSDRKQALRKMSINSLKRQHNDVSIKAEGTEKEVEYMNYDQLERRSYEEMHKERVSKPLIKQTRVSFFILDDPNESNEQNEPRQSNKELMKDSIDRRDKTIRDQSQVQEYRPRHGTELTSTVFQNSLLPRRNINQQVEEGGFWDGLIRKFF